MQVFTIPFQFTHAKNETPYMNRLSLTWLPLTHTYSIISYGNISSDLHLSDLGPLSHKQNYGLKQDFPVQKKINKQWWKY